MDKKHSVWVLWIGSLLLIFLTSGWLAVVGHVIFWITFVAHVAECFMNLELFRKAGGSMANHLAQTMIYGLFYWTPLKERIEAEGAAAE